MLSQPDPQGVSPELAVYWAAMQRGMSTVTGQTGGVGAIPCGECGTPFVPRQSNQTHCSSRCYDRWYNRRRPAVRANPELRQRALDFDPVPLRVARPPHNPALVTKLKPAARNAFELLDLGKPVSRVALHAVAGNRYAARICELRDAGYRILGPCKSPRHAIYETEPLGPNGLEMYRLITEG